MSANPSLLLVGCGKMGSALLTRWQQERPAGISEFHVIEPTSAHVASGGKQYTSLEHLPAEVKPSVIVFAVKPQSLAGILVEYKSRFGVTPLYLSIAAGKDLAFFARHLGAGAQVIRAMPNTPAMIGHGMTALAGSDTLPESRRHVATQLMEAVGEVVWVEEEQMHGVTALSGSGPAYVFLFLDALTQAGIESGLDEEDAKFLAMQTVWGSCALAASGNDSFEQLRKNVTSPNGTTQAALDVLMKNDAFIRLVGEAMKAAAKRSVELSQ